MYRRRPISAAVVASVLFITPVSLRAAPSEDLAKLRRQASELAYNLDREEALALLRKAVRDHPDDASLHRALASVLWLSMLYSRGAVTVDHYLGSFSRTQVELKKPPPDLDREFRAHVARAIELAEARVTRAPADAQARYDLGAAVGLQASYVATVEGRLFAGFKTARRAYDQHEKVMELDRSRRDAGLIVGTYRYVVSTLSMPLRMMAYVVGFGGGRERGIEMLQETAAHDGESRTDAMFALVLVHNRERRYDDALRVLGELRRLYPRNRLVVLEMGATALRGGRAAEADALLTEGIGLLAKERRTLMPGERALWHYKRGAARAALDRFDAARSDLHVAVEPDAQPWVSGRAHAELGRIALRSGDHTAARRFAATGAALCKQGNDPVCLESARRLMRRAGGR